MSDKTAVDSVVINPHNEAVATKGAFWITAGQLFKYLRGSVTIPTFFIVAGFFTIHSYLFKTTSMFTYKIDVSVYIAAGMNTILGALVNTITYLIPSLSQGLAIALVLVVFMLLLLLIGWWLLRRNQQLQKLSKQVEPPVNGYVIPALERVFTINSFLMISLIIAVAALTGLRYGYSGYEYSPRFIGGGMPARVVLLFKQPDLIPSLGLPFALDATYPGRSEPLEMLMELSDGVLVRQSTTQAPIIIKNDMLYAILDADPPTSTSP